MPVTTSTNRRGLTALGIVLLAICGVCAGCGNPGDGSPGGAITPAALPSPYRIVTTCGMVTDIVKAVAGARAEVSGLMGEGVDPHLYKPTRNDVQALLSADVVFYSGLMLEGRMADTFSRVGRQGKPVFAVTEGIDPSFLLEPEGFQGHWDPHVWMDVSAWSRCVGFVADSLAELDPSHADEYQSNAAAYRAQLAALDDYVKRVIATIPAEQKVLVTAHDAFGYFSRAYDIPVKSVQGITTESEAAVRDIEDLVDFLVEKKVPAIFVESSVSPASLKAVIAGAQARGWKVKIGGELYSDAMGPPGTYEGTYIGMIDHNATTIARALGGEAPERGLNGKLATTEMNE